jgi:hypothetical protein
MQGRNLDLIRKILKRAMDEGREGRVLMIQQRLEAAREMPEDHAHILRQLQLFGRVIPQGSVFSSHMIH